MSTVTTQQTTEDKRKKQQQGRLSTTSMAPPPNPAAVLLIKQSLRPLPGEKPRRPLPTPPGTRSSEDAQTDAGTGGATPTTDVQTQPTSTPTSQAPSTPTQPVPPPQPPAGGNVSMEELTRMEEEFNDKTERELIALYGEDNWKYSKVSVLGLKAEDITDVLRAGWQGVRPRDRRAKLDKLADKAAERQKRLADHYNIMRLGEKAAQAAAAGGQTLTDDEKAFKIYYDTYNKSLTVDKKKTSRCRSDAEKAMANSKRADGKKNSGLFKATAAKRKEEEEREQIRKFKEDAKAEHGIELAGATLKALQKELAQKLKTKAATDQMALLEEERVKLTDQLGEHFTRVYIALMEKNGKSASALSYREHRNIIHKAREIGVRNKAIHDQHEARLEIGEYYEVFRSRSSRMTKDEKYELILAEHTKMAEIAMQKRQATYTSGDEELKASMKKVDDDKKLTPEQKEERIHDELEKLEKEHLTAHKMGIAYVYVGKTQNGKPLTSAQRRKLIEEQLYLLKKHESRYIVSEDYEKEFDRLKKLNEENEKYNSANPNAAARPITSAPEMVRKSTQAGLDKSSGIIKAGKQERLDFHRHNYLDALIAKYQQKYPKYFDKALEELSQGKKMDDPKEKEKVIKQAREAARQKEHDEIMAGTDDISKAYQAEYNASYLTQGHKRSNARKAKRHAENMQNEEYKRMYETLQSSTVREKVVRRRAEKHMRRMKDGENPAYKEGFDAQMKTLSGTPTKADLKKARTMSRKRAKMKNQEEKNKKAVGESGDQLTQLTQDAYLQKYANSSFKARRHAESRAREIKQEQDHHSRIEESPIYKSTYEAAIKAGSNPSDARKAATKRMQERDEAERQQVMYQGKVVSKGDTLPELQAEYAFYEKKYPDDRKKAYKHAKAAAKAIRDAKMKQRTVGVEIYDHPQFKEAFADAYARTGDEKKAYDEAVAVCSNLLTTDDQRTKQGKFVAKDTRNLSAEMVEGMADWADSDVVKLVRKVKQVEAENPEATEGLLDKIKAATLGRIKERTVDRVIKKDKVDKQVKDDEEKYGLGDVVDAGKELKEQGSEVYDQTKETVTAVKEFINPESVENVAEEVSSSGFSFTDLKSLAGPIMALIKLGKEIVEYIIDKKKGKTSEKSTEILTMKVMEFMPQIFSAQTSVMNMVAKTAMEKLTPFVGAMQGILDAVASLAVNGLKLDSALTGAKAIQMQMELHKEDLMTKENRGVFVLQKGTLDRQTKIKMDRTLIRNALQKEEKKPETERDADRLKALQQIHLDFEYEGLYQKLIRERSLDIAQNMLSVAESATLLVPEAGTMISAILTLINKGTTLVRSSVKHIKQWGRERVARRPMHIDAGLYDLDRTKAAKHRDRSMFAGMLYDELASLPLPEDMPEEERERRSWLGGTITRYRRMRAYTTMAMDIRTVLKSDTKEQILEIFVTQMAASADHY